MNGERYRLDLAESTKSALQTNYNSAKGMMGFALLLNLATFIALFSYEFATANIFMVLVSLTILGHYYRESRDLNMKIAKADADILKYQDKLQAQLPIKKEW